MAATASGQSGPDRVCAVVVAHEPERAALDALLAAIAPQVAHVLVVDNATRTVDVAAVVARHPGVALLAGAENVGLGAAINRGARRAAELGCTFVLPLDQDSAPAADMVANLLAAFRALSPVAPVAAVGPRFADARTGAAAPFVRIGFPLNRKLHPADGATVECDFLITSGCLLPLAVLERVGGMDEALFIDNVDLEWCFRARHHGYRLYGVAAARMQHRIGDRLRRLPLGLGEVVVHSPARLYYMMRNRLLLYRRRETPRTWIAQDIPRAVLKFLRMGLFIAPRAANARYMLAGVRDGLRGASGPIGDRVRDGVR